MGVIWPFGGIKISRSSPKITVRITNNRDDITLSQLNLRRVGERTDFAAYTPIRVGDDYLEFMFDDLLFDRAFGRYLARLIVNERESIAFHLQYVDDTSMEIRNA